MKSKRERPDCSFSENFITDLLNPFLDTYHNIRTRNEICRHIYHICFYFQKNRMLYHEFQELSLDDAKIYFLSYLPGLCEKGIISYDTYAAELAACRKFGEYLEKRISFLRENNIGRYKPYKNPFVQIIKPAVFRAVHTERIFSDEDMELALNAAKKYDLRLYIIMLLSLRMMIPGGDILALKTSMLHFVRDGNLTVGMISYAKRKKPIIKRMPADIVEPVRRYYESQCNVNEYMFTNAYGNPMSTANLTYAMKKLEEKSGVHVEIRGFRCKALLDLVANNQSTQGYKEIGDYAGLSEQMIKEYGNALNYIEKGCIADSSHYIIIDA